jgi:hypothetical protein
MPKVDARVKDVSSLESSIFCKLFDVLDWPLTISGARVTTTRMVPIEVTTNSSPWVELADMPSNLRVTRPS